MSDDDKKLNEGVTLPEAVNATYNASFSPFFLGRVGYRAGDSAHLVRRGHELLAWPKTTQAKNWAYFLCIGGNNSRSAPNPWTITSHALSLRCLVSTNNR